MLLRKLLAVAVFAAPVGLMAGDKKHQNHNPYPVYPKSEALYLKRITQPTINCGACYGYYPTQWKSWNEGCGQPEVVYQNGTDTNTKPADVKPTDVKPTDPKLPVPNVNPMGTDPKLPVPNPNPMGVEPKLPVPNPDPKPTDPKNPTGSGKTTLKPVPPPAVTMTVSIPQLPPSSK